jgi:hypothetical protein
MSDWMSQIGGLLQNYAGQSGAQDSANDDFDQIVQHAPNTSLAEGLAAAFRSNETPSFGNMVAGMFSNSSGEQKASLLNTLAPIVLSQVMGGGGGGGNNPLGALLGGGGGGALSALLGGGGGGGLGSIISMLGGGGSPLGALLGGGGGGGLASIVSALASGQQVTPEMADQVSDDEVRALAEHAEKQDPSIIDTISNFYSEHPTLVKSLGAVALTIAISQIANRNNS